MNRKDPYGALFTLAIASLVAVWLSFAWTAVTGLTLATRSSRGRFATEEDRARSRHIAVLTTVIAVPVALWAGMMRRR
ncbi:MAG TPA: hypothetical protein VF432_24495 [Thermoanaerobaculia bacterium]